MTDAELRKQAEAMMSNQNFSDMRDIIAASEGGTYNRLFGFDEKGKPRYFTDFTKFPDSPGRFRRPDGSIGYSNDAGRYQININTYKRMAKRLGISDFSKHSQDLIANALILENSRASKALQDGDIGAAVNALNKVWVSLPGGPQGTGHRSMQFIQNTYNNLRAKRGEAPVQLASNIPVQTPGAAVGGGQQFSFFSQRVPQGGFFNRAMDVIANQTWSDIPAPGVFPVMNDQTGNKIVFSGNPNVNATDAQGNNILMSRLFNKDPNTSYGLAYADNGLRPTLTTPQDGTKLIDDSGLPPVEVPQAVYDVTQQPVEAPQAQSEVVQVPQVQTTAQVSGAVLPDDTPHIATNGSPAPNATANSVLTTVSPNAAILATGPDPAVQAANIATMRRAAGLDPNDPIDVIIPDTSGARMLMADQDRKRTSLA